MSGRPNCFNVFQSFFGFFVFSFSFSLKYAFFFFRIKFWTSFRASLQISSSTCHFVNINLLYSFSRVCILSAISPSNRSLVLFLTLTVLKGPAALATQSNLLIKSLYALSGLWNLKLTKSIQSRYLYKWCLIRLKSLALPKMEFRTLHLSCSSYLLPKSTQFLHLSSLTYQNHVYNRIASLPNTATWFIVLSCCTNF